MKLFPSWSRSKEYQPFTWRCLASLNHFFQFQTSRPRKVRWVPTQKHRAESAEPRSNRGHRVDRGDRGSSSFDSPEISAWLRSLAWARPVNISGTWVQTWVIKRFFTLKKVLILRSFLNMCARVLNQISIESIRIVRKWDVYVYYIYIWCVCRFIYVYV